MKQCFSLFVVVAVASCVEAADNDDDGEVEAGVGRASIVDEDGDSLCIGNDCLVDLGGVLAGDHAERAVYVVNVGDGDLDVVTSGFVGDDAVSFGALDVVLGKDEAADLVVSVDTDEAGLVEGSIGVAGFVVAGRANVVRNVCQPSVELRVSAVNGSRVVGTPAIEVFDDVELEVTASSCVPSGSISGYVYRLVSAPEFATTDTDFGTDSTAHFSPSLPGEFTIAVAVTDDLGTENEVGLTLDVAPLPGALFAIAFQGALHLTPAGDGFCGDGDCSLVSCPSERARFFGPSYLGADQLASDDYELAVDGAGSQFVKVFSDRRLIGEFSLGGDGLRTVGARIEVRAGAVALFSVPSVAIACP